MGKRGDAARLEALGCSAYLLKPVKQQMLRDVLMTVVSQSGAAPSPLVTRHKIAEQKRQNLRILLAEDNLINQKLAVTLLQKAGYSVDAVESGTYAVEKAKEGGYNAILMDVQMSEMDGFEATGLIREWEGRIGKHTPIIAMSMLERWTSSDEKPVASFETTESSTAVNEYASIQNPIFEDDGLFGEESEPHASPEQSKPQHTRTDFSNAVPMDMQSALFHFDDDKNFMMEMLTVFMAGLPARLSEMQTALNENNANILARLAHNLKGTCLNFGTEPLAKLSAELEEMGKHDDIQFAPAIAEQMQEEVHRLQEYVQELR